MDTENLSHFIACSRLKSARRKKQHGKKAFEKKILFLFKTLKKLRKQKANLPWMPLKEPYQKGWARFFVVRDDVARSRFGEFYQHLLEKINTFQYDQDKRFRGKKKRKKGKIYLTKVQTLKEFSTYEWKSNSCKLTDSEKQHFYPTQKWEKNKVSVKYVFSEPWRYVLTIKPNMITHTKMIDSELEQEIQFLEDFFECQNLYGKLWNLKGKSAKWRPEKEKEKYKNPLKTKHWQDLID